MIIIVCGKHNSGKSTFSNYFNDLENLLDIDSKPIVILDADKIRECLAPVLELDFKKENRTKFLRTLACMASNLERQGFKVVVNAVMPLREHRKIFMDIAVEYQLYFMSEGKDRWNLIEYEPVTLEECNNFWLVKKVAISNNNSLKPVFEIEHIQKGK